MKNMNWENISKEIDESAKNLIGETVKTHVLIPIEPPEDLLYSMALRYNHAFGLSNSAKMTDEEIEKMRKEDPFWGSQFLTKRERDVILGQMAQLYEEVVGKGFYKYKS